MGGEFVLFCTVIAGKSSFYLNVIIKLNLYRPKTFKIVFKTLNFSHRKNLI